MSNEDICPLQKPLWGKIKAGYFEFREACFDDGILHRILI